MREVRIDLDVELSSHQLQKTGSNPVADPICRQCLTEGSHFLSKWNKLIEFSELLVWNNSYLFTIPVSNPRASHRFFFAFRCPICFASYSMREE